MPPTPTPTAPLFTNDAVVLGLLMLILAVVFYTSNLKSKAWQTFYTFVPSLLLCYFLPSLLNSFGLVDGANSGLYKMASRYLLPACLVLLTISLDFQAIVKLGPKALVVFLAGTLGVMLGGPIAILVVGLLDPSILHGQGPDEVWRGLATIAGSWIGGSANQTAMKEVFQASDGLFSALIAVDVFVANLWTAFLLFGAGRSAQLDRWLRANNQAIEETKERIAAYQASQLRIPSLQDLLLIGAVGLGSTGVAHYLADLIVPALEAHRAFWERLYLGSIISGFFWIVLIATTLGLLLSFTRARTLEGAGASRIGSVFIYILVATIGLQMDITAIFKNLSLFLVGVVWMLVHVLVIGLVARLIRAPYFFVAVGSQANIGGAASAPIVASAFHPALAPVGVLLAVLGYVLGTYGAWLSGLVMQWLFGQLQ
ncbi:MAG: DUF819 family protein [Bernardetiaceae bacterium]|jgi:uncharacterized membrane protein|nr:DUF819 family protein [Bernardetiaceae bacterium]